MGMEPHDELIAKVDAKLASQNPEVKHHTQRSNGDDDIQGVVIRDAIATNMWNDYVM